MTNAGLNQTISELREPLHTVVARMRPEWLGVGEQSPDRAWVWTLWSSRIEWCPRDWTGSEEASAVLLDELIAGNIGKAFIFSQWISGPRKIVFRVCDEQDNIVSKAEIYACEADRKACIALAWLEWKKK